MQTQLTQQSPLFGITTPFEQSDLRIADRSLDGKLHIEGARAEELIRMTFGDAPAAIGQVTRYGDATYIGQIAPTRFLLTTDSESSKFTHTMTEIAADNFITITDQTDGHGGILLTNKRAPELLSTVCGLDFRPTEFPPNHVKISSVAKVRATIWHVDKGWLLHVGRSYTQYLWNTLIEAVHDLNAYA